MSKPKTDREWAIDEIGEGLVRYNEWLATQTPEMLAATDAKIRAAAGPESELDLIEQYIVEQSIIALGGR